MTALSDGSTINPLLREGFVMDRLTRRYLITGAIGIGSMLAALAVVLIKASEKVARADAVVKPALSVDVRKPVAPPRPQKKH